MKNFILTIFLFFLLSLAEELCHIAKLCRSSAGGFILGSEACRNSAEGFILGSEVCRSSAGRFILGSEACRSSAGGFILGSEACRSSAGGFLKILKIYSSITNWQKHKIEYI